MADHIKIMLKQIYLNGARKTKMKLVFALIGLSNCHCTALHYKETQSMTSHSKTNPFKDCRTWHGMACHMLVILGPTKDPWYVLALVQYEIVISHFFYCVLSLKYLQIMRLNL